MHLESFEAEITQKLKWKKVEEIPNFPLNSYEDVIKNVNAGQFEIGIDYSVANQAAEWLYGKSHVILFLLLASPPYIIALLSMILSIVLGNHWLLIGFVIGFAGQIFSNPFNPFRGFMTIIAWLSLLLLVYGLWTGQETITYLSAFYIVPFFINRFLYNMNQKKLKNVAMKSERVFVYLYQNRGLGLKDLSTGQTYWYFEKE
jgi:hypothetical protein